MNIDPNSDNPADSESVEPATKQEVSGSGAQTPVLPEEVELNLQTELPDNPNFLPPTSQEWIEDIKTAIESTRDDPFVQAKELGKIKTHYLRGRHNRHIKLGEDHLL